MYILEVHSLSYRHSVDQLIKLCHQEWVLCESLIQVGVVYTVGVVDTDLSLPIFLWDHHHIKQTIRVVYFAYGGGI